MELINLQSTLPVLLLYNLDRSWSVEAIGEARSAIQNLSDALCEVGHPVDQVRVEVNQIEWVLRNYDPADYIVLNWCEEIPGVPRSSAFVAYQLEQLGFAYTGADSSTLAFSQDKRRVKQRLAEQRIPTPRWNVHTSPEPGSWNYFPAIVKPAFEHSSLGITRQAVVQSPDELAERVRYVIETFQQPALVEDFIAGREFHVSIIGDGVLHVLPIAEMDFSAFDDIRDRLCTYDSKFEPDSAGYMLTEVRLPAPLTQEEQLLLEAIARAAYRATNCRDYARLDIRLRAGIFYVLDVNPNADISADTSLALAAELAGLSYGELGSLLVNLAARRHPVFSKQA